MDIYVKWSVRVLLAVSSRDWKPGAMPAIVAAFSEGCESVAGPLATSLVDYDTSGRVPALTHSPRWQ